MRGETMGVQPLTEEEWGKVLAESRGFEGEEAERRERVAKRVRKLFECFGEGVEVGREVLRVREEWQVVLGWSEGEEPDTTKWPLTAAGVARGERVVGINGRWLVRAAALEEAGAEVGVEEFRPETVCRLVGLWVALVMEGKEEGFWRVVAKKGEELQLDEKERAWVNGVLVGSGARRL